MAVWSLSSTPVMSRSVEGGSSSYGGILSSVVVVVLVRFCLSLKEVAGAPFNRKNSSLAGSRWSCRLFGLFDDLWRSGRCLLLLLCRGLWKLDLRRMVESCLLVVVRLGMVVLTLIVV